MGRPAFFLRFLPWCLRPNRKWVGYENPSEGAVQIAAGQLFTRIRATDSDVKQVISLPRSVLHMPRLGRSLAVRKLTRGAALAVYEDVATLFCVSLCCFAFDCMDEGARTR